MECNQTFTQEQIPLLEFSGYKCNKCQSPVIIESISVEIKNELAKIEQENLLNPSDIEIVMELSKQGDAVPAKEIAEELDISSYSIAQRSRNLDLRKGLVKRHNTTPKTYELTETAKNIYSTDNKSSNDNPSKK